MINAILENANSQKYGKNRKISIPIPIPTKNKKKNKLYIEKTSMLHC